MNAKTKTAIVGIVALLLLGLGAFVGYRAGRAAGIAQERVRGDTLERIVDQATRDRLLPDLGAGKYHEAIGGIRSENTAIGDSADRARSGADEALRIIEELLRREGSTAGGKGQN